MAQSPELDQTAPGPARSAEHTPAQGGLAAASAVPAAASDGLADTAQPGRTTGPASTAALSSAAASGELLPFASWERYKILSFLGAGGMGTVYKARDPKLNRYVAIKFLRASQAELHSSRERRHFEREARAQAALEHPHICKIYEVGEVEGQPYIAMQYIAGSSLSGLSQVLSVTDKLQVVRQVAEALECAHRQNLIHRDLKPGNILVERRADGTYFPYLMDFGLAKEVDSNTQTSTGGVEGTPAYMAPEQARGETRALERRTDVYGLGATLYGALAGRPPFVGSSTDVLMAVLLEEPPRLRTLLPTLPREIETVVHKCLEKEPARRYASAQGLADDLQRLLAGESIVARPPGLGRRALLFSRRHKLLVVGVATALLATLLLGSLALRIRFQSAEQARLAQRLGQEIEKMEWLLRSARQLPLHDLNREKDLVRARMQALQEELGQYGERSRGLAYYALGRGHLALHEYPAALSALRQAQSLGVQSAELHYALGLALGKHYEAAIAQSRLAGAGEWAKKQLQQFEPTYLRPAIDSLQRSRALKSDAPEYLEALIAFYQRDYERALERAAAAQRTAPWLYEALKLAGDVHLERALQTRDRGDYEVAEKAFDTAIERYRAAAAIAASDAGIYDDLAEAWLRRAETRVERVPSVQLEYESVLDAANKSRIADSLSVMPDLKESVVIVLINKIEIGKYDESQIDAGMIACKRYIKANPDNPFAGEVLTLLLSQKAAVQRLRGDDPSQTLGAAAAILEPILARHPNFLWGYNDLGYLYDEMASVRMSVGDIHASDYVDKSISAYEQALRIDSGYENAYNNIIWSNLKYLNMCHNKDCLEKTKEKAKRTFIGCQAINKASVNCHDNYGLFHAQLAQRLWLAGERPDEALRQAGEYLGQARKLGGKLLDAEQHVALAAWVRAMVQVERGEDPAAALGELEAALATCLELAADDAMCRSLAARADWVRADYALAQQRKESAAIAQRALEAALVKAKRATACKEKYPEGWQTLAETQLRIARLAPSDPRRREAAIASGLAALAPGLSINPHHAGSHVVRGKLQLLRASTSGDVESRRRAAQAAQEAFAAALQHDPLLKAYVEPRLQQAGKLLGSLSPSPAAPGATAKPPT